MPASADVNCNEFFDKRQVVELLVVVQHVFWNCSRGLYSCSKFHQDYLLRVDKFSESEYHELLLNCMLYNAHSIRPSIWVAVPSKDCLPIPSKTELESANIALMTLKAKERSLRASMPILTLSKEGE